ncbi:hypothetical protein K2X14_08305 [Acetobacter sp. TBRC 12305]|uniref:Uncharacterized protein n=1 Tax=Acetobacter garciniae TaxID=2817435 RepID=A0A939KRI8_9PROT|nr:hypothetical protein [Acetobacter garciniae]MBO1325196.1 hypothetical protein [Acetobacter garciniae]MBX0344833.1 hypothetical protein [Acetobacter garciniae]
MGHNYARPLTTAQKMERLLERIPPSWSVVVERRAGEATWRALAQAPGQDGAWSDPAPDPATALEDTWRRNRTVTV